MDVNILLICVYVYYTPAWCPQWSERDFGFPGTGVKRCEPPCVCYELNLGPLPRQQFQWLSYLQLYTAKLFKECMAEEEQELERISTRAVLLNLPNAVTPTITPFLLLLQSYNFATAINCKIL